jgi:hypothetical protein
MPSAVNDDSPILPDGVALTTPRSFLHGAVYTNGWPNLWTDAVFRWLQASSVILFPHHLYEPGTPDVSDKIVRRILAINPSCQIMLRMYQSHDYMDSPEEYGRAQAALARDAYNLGITHGCYDVEPNNSWEPENLAPYSKYLRTSLDAYYTATPRPPAGFKLGFPTLAAYPGARLNPWLDELTKYKTRFHTIWYNCYWQDLPVALQTEEELRRTPQWRDPAYGGLHIGYQQRFGDMLLINGEYGNSLRDRKPYPGRGVIFAAMAEQYPQWLAWVHSSRAVYAVHAFILPGRKESHVDAWMDFFLSELVAKNVGRWSVLNRAN